MSEHKNIPELRFPEFHGEWEHLKFSEIAEFKNGLNFGKEQEGTGLKVIGVRDFKDHMSISYSELSSVNVPEKQKASYLLRNNDLLFVRSNGNRELIGRVLFIDNVNEEIGYSGFTIRARFDSNYAINPYFYAHFFKSEAPRKQFLILGGGTNISNLNQEILSNIRIPKPLLSEQQKIASFFTAIDKKISQLRQKKTLLEQYKKGVMQKIFSQEIRFKDVNGQEFPKWEKKKLGALLYQKSVRNNDDRVSLVLSVSNTKGFITQGEQFDNHRVASKDVTNYKIVSRGDFAYNPSRINVGSIARLINYKEGIVSPMYVVFGLKNSLNTIFFENWITTHLFRHLVKVSCSGSVRDSLNFDDMCDFNFLLPNLSEQSKIANFLSSIDNKISHTQIQIEKAELWKKGLLQKMFV